ncbi:aldehyde dehydrogenase (NADP(+)) [Planomonospora parontospora]|uniref:aldehyde dehydrogenase (NADP(+)) n=1 Tax=Planomonospora parontospora TaxID=58119 RepID=UPI0016712257|nr:aldehyde dehydrogenase (NADP(+)) [Planomonospora parontospora]GGL08205.1 aldehyde dehydrogenase [Planomonospora parontospora subsp. antibiotica]GII14566.1 aldehyde dehydrogenase [Planomonospora parontospora subsp. antibiotica]
MIHSYDPRTGETVGEPFPANSAAEADAIVRAAHAAGRVWRETPATERARELSGGSGETRAQVLEAVAEALEKNVEELWRVADAETALGEARLRGEVARAAGQFRLFAKVLRDGGHAEAVIDHASAEPPVPDLRRMNRPLPGVVGVYAASNFPFAFSVIGGDTASALAAGCAVVVKAHDGHPRTSELSAEVIRGALPDPALLGLVRGREAGGCVVRHPHVVGVGFTGSIPGGKAIQAMIDERPDPIPFYGELGSVNPVVVLPSARREGLAEGFAASLTLGVGQFCTNPGLLFVPEDAGLLVSLAEAVSATTGGPMLTARMREGFLHELERLSELDRLAEGRAGEGAYAVTPQLFTVGLEAFAAALPGVAEECFGPAGIVVTYRDPAELPAVLERLDGSLTATVHATDPAEAEEIAEVLTRKAGRVIWNGWPTGVAVRWAMHHGGPWPSSTAPAHTSVGAAAIRRWLVPTSYQDWPAELLPPELRDDNPLGVPRRVDGTLTL